MATLLLLLICAGCNGEKGTSPDTRSPVDLSVVDSSPVDKARPDLRPDLAPPDKTAVAQEVKVLFIGNSFVPAGVSAAVAKTLQQAADATATP